MYDAIIVGAGHNGLIAACYLARAGKRVIVLERREIVGGACVTEEIFPGYRVSTAAYLCSLLMPEIVRDLELERYGFEVYRRETAGFAPFPDGRSLMLFADAAKTRAALTEFCRDTPADIDAFFQFEADVEHAADILDRFMTDTPPDAIDIEQAFTDAGIESLYQQFVVGSVRDLLDARFQSEQLKAVIATDGLIGTYGGVSTPGTAYVLLHHYLGRVLGSRGSWGYVRGGMGRITQALAADFEAHGGEIRLGSPVAQILTENGHAMGIQLESGEVIEAQTVLCNADPHRTFNVLMEPNPGAPIGESLVKQGGASAKINLAVSELPRFTCLPIHDGIGAEHLGTIHLCPDMEYLERAWDEAQRGYPSTAPMIEVYLQTATDASLTPPGKHILSLFVQYFPYHIAPELDLDTERERFADRVIAIVGQYAPNVQGSILHRQILTPRDLEARFALTGGHIFHGDLLAPNLWNRRPADGFSGAKTPIAGLYLCGSGAHPGGCVYGAPGYNAAQVVLLAAPTSALE